MRNGTDRLRRAESPSCTVAEGALPYLPGEPPVDRCPLRLDRLGSSHRTRPGTAGLYYLKVKAEVDLHTPAFDVSEDRDIDFWDPMFGARAYLALTKKFGVSAAGQIGGFGAGSELNYLAGGNLVYNFTQRFALSGGYRYWHWKYEDNDATLSRLEQTLHGPVVSLQLKY